MAKRLNRKKLTRVVQFFAAYLVASWTFLQFIDWVLNRYNISPYWVDLLLWIFIGIIPSLLIYLCNQERINKKTLKIREKIIFPLNVLLIMIITYFGFGNSDLGATTKEVSYSNDVGELERKIITKEEFRIGIPIYGFKQIDNDSTVSWMRYGIGALLAHDLEQNKSISPNFTDVYRTTDKIRESSLFNHHYLDGDFKKVDGEFEVNAYLRKASNGNIIKKQGFIGSDILDIIDDISIFTASNIGLVEGNAIQYIDLPVKEFISNDLEALKHFVEGDYRKATEIDTTFALAYLFDAKNAIGFNVSTIQEQDIIKKAYANKNKLPLQRQLDVLIQRNLAYNLLDEAEKQVKLQLEVDPNNGFYNEVLYSIYGETKQVDAYYEEAKRLFENDPKPKNGVIYAEAALVKGEEASIIKKMNALEIINPNIINYKLKPLLHNGEIDKAEAVFEEIKLLHPDNNNRSQVYEKVIKYLKSHTPTEEELTAFVGYFRSQNNEQTYTNWIENNRLIQHVNNQRMRAFIPASKNSIVSGYILGRTWENSLLKKSDGEVYALLMKQFDKNYTVSLVYWKIDEAINLANDAFNLGNLEKAEPLYIEAITKNPEHFYLKNILAHIQYVKTKTVSELQNQFEAIAGSYGPRDFWVDKGKLYYKRDILNTYELLPISDNIFIDLTRYATNMGFEEAPNGTMASVSLAYDYVKKEWIKSKGSSNYFLKTE